MGTRRCGSSECLLTDDRSAVIGGFGIDHVDGSVGTLGTCEALVRDNGAERWEPLPPMLEARANFACAAVGGCVIVVGGHGQTGPALSSAEVYEEATGVWRRLPCVMPRALANMGSALF